MLFRIELENFYSIRTLQIVDLAVAANVPDEFNHLAPLWKGADARAPKVVGIFGANASGKSNILRALAFLSWFVQHSFKVGPTQNLPYEPFNKEGYRSQPTRLAIHFAGPANPLAPKEQQTELCRYAYEVELIRELDGPSEHMKVLSETLRYWPNGEGKGKALLTRRENRVKGSPPFPLGRHSFSIGTIMPPNASVIATLAHIGHPQAELLRAAAATIASNLLIEKFSIDDDQLIRHYANYPQLLEALNRDIQRIDLGIKQVHIEQGSSGPVASFSHHGLASPLRLYQESHGTRAFLQVYPLIFSVLQTGGVAAIDELDNAIHPLILPEIIRRFYDPKTNPHNAQLWMTCQNASLLEELSKEEIFFCEKDNEGQSSVYGLSDIKAVRRGDNYYRKYLGGEFGAVPRFG